MESRVNCGEDFGFCRECDEMSPEDFEQLTATVRLALKRFPWLPGGEWTGEKVGGKAGSKVTNWKLSFMVVKAKTCSLD